MQWLLHGPMTPAVGEALKRHEHQVHAPLELDLQPDAPAETVLKAAAKKQWDIMTTDAKLPESLFESNQPFSRTIVFLQLTGGDVEQDDAIDRLFDRYKRLSPKRLYTVTGSRVKIRQLPGST